MIRAILRPPYRAARRQLVRWRHPGRNRAAHRQLQSAGPFDELLFVCLGNVCRSPYAEFAMPALLEEWGMTGVVLRSAGFIGPGRQSPEKAQEIALEEGVDLTTHRSKLISMVEGLESPLVIVMEGPQKPRAVAEMAISPDRVVVLGDLDPETPVRREIRDPWGHETEVFRESFRRITRCLEQLRPYLREPARG